MSAIEGFDPVVEAGKIAFDRRGNGEPVLLISGFPQTRRSWKKIVALLAPNFEAIAADLPSFGEFRASPGSCDDRECRRHLSRVCSEDRHSDARRRS